MGRLLSPMFPEDQRCACCNRPLYYRETVICHACSDKLIAIALPPDKRRFPRNLPLISDARAAFPYTGVAKRLEQALKYKGARLAAEPLSHIMAYEAARLAPDAIAHVPLYESRRRERGYDQAMELSLRVGDKTGLSVLAGALTRVRDTPTQVGKSASERRENVKGAFTADKEAISGKRILLIDDVLTTGATACACAASLMRAGAADVTLLTACRA